MRQHGAFPAQFKTEMQERILTHDTTGQLPWLILKRSQFRRADEKWSCVRLVEFHVEQHILLDERDQLHNAFARLAIGEDEGFIAPHHF